jgi:hypothetical protein
MSNSLNVTVCVTQLVSETDQINSTQVTICNFNKKQLATNCDYKQLIVNCFGLPEDGNIKCCDMS